MTDPTADPIPDVYLTTAPDEVQAFAIEAYEYATTEPASHRALRAAVDRVWRAARRSLKERIAELEAEASAREGELGDMRASLSAAEADRDDVEQDRDRLRELVDAACVAELVEALRRGRALEVRSSPPSLPSRRTRPKDNAMAEACVFCRIIRGDEPATVVRRWPDAVAIIPLNPVVDGHLLVIPVEHVEDFTTVPRITGAVMARAAEIAVRPCNLIASAGREATQSVFHLHAHIVPRAEDDGIALPWYSGRRRRRAVPNAA